MYEQEEWFPKYLAVASVILVCGTICAAVRFVWIMSVPWRWAKWKVMHLEVAVFLEIDPYIVLFSTQEGRKLRILLFFLLYFLLSPPILTT